MTSVSPRACLQTTGTAMVVAALLPLVASAQPAAPAGLWATAGDEEAVLTWEDPANPNVARYEFRFGTGEAPAFNAWAVVPGSRADTVAHTVSGLANGTRYAFEVRATDDDGAGEAARASTMLAAAPSSAVEVPDGGLRRRIEATLGLASGASLTQGDLAKLARLHAGWESIVNLEGLEFAVNLVTLYLWGNEIADVSALAGLTSLTELQLSYNEIADVSALAGLTSLTELQLSDNEIADVSPLSGLTSLTRLRLARNEIADVSPFAGLTSLTWLWLSGNEIADVSPLSGLTSLKELWLGGNEIADVSPLSGLTSLTLLWLSRNEIADVSPLAGLTSLTRLRLWYNEIADVSPLSGLSSLTELWLADNGIVDVSPLSGLTFLTFLNLSGNEIADVSPLAGLTSLSRLWLSSNEIADVSPLSALTALTVLDLSNNEVADVSPLSGLTSLMTLYLYGNVVSDISALGGFGQLSSLDLSRNAVADISALLESGLPGIDNYVDLRGNPLRDGQADHVQTLRESGTVVMFDDGHRVPLFPAAAPSAVPGAMAQARASGSEGLFHAGAAGLGQEAGPRPAHFPGASIAGFVRVVNHSAEAGSVSIEAVDETGERRGPVLLAIDAGQALHFDALDLEQGNPAKGMRGVGEAVGDWRLVLRSALDIEVLGYAQTPDGFVTSLHDLAPEIRGESEVPTFNPGSNRRQVGWLRLTNTTSWDRRASVSATDDSGSGRSGGLVMPARRTLDLTAAQLEPGQGSGEGGVDVAGIGDGAGKWRLGVHAPGLRAMSLLQSPTGHLANISTRTAVSDRHPAYHSWERGGRYRVPLFLAASADSHSFLRIVNPLRVSAAVTLRAYDGAGVAREPIVLTLGGREVLHLNSCDLEFGNAAKGLSGIGAGVGDWHLEVSAKRRFEVLAYARSGSAGALRSSQRQCTTAGFVASLHDTAPRAADGSLWIPFFNPGSERAPASRLRLVNWGGTAAEATITGVDDAGNAPGGAVRASVPARSSRDYMAWELETGEGAGLSGSLGDGDGRWRLRVSAPGDVQAMSLLGLPAGHITNLSTTPRHPRE